MGARSNTFCLGNAAEVILGTSPSGETYNANGVGTPLLNGPTEFGSKHPNPIQWTSAPIAMAEPGDILFCVRGSSIGRRNVADQQYCIGRGLAAIRGSRLVTTEFLWHLLDDIEAAVVRRARGAGSTFPCVTGVELRSWPVCLPPIAHQMRIAEILHSVDEAIEATRAVVEQTRRFNLALEQKLLAKGIDHTRFQRTKIGQIPADWHVDTVGSLCEFSSGTGFSHSDWSTKGLPIIRIQNLNGSTDFNYYDGDPDPKWIVEPGELLFAWAGVKGVSFGPCIWPGPRGLLNQHIYRIRPNKGANRRWLYAILGEVTHRIEAKAHGFKTSLVHVHKADITDQIVAIPPPDEQAEIARRVEDMERWLTSQEQHLKQLESTKSALSQGLLTGRIKVLLK